MLSKLLVSKDIAGVPVYVLAQSNLCKSATLAANTEEHFTIATNADNLIALFSFAPGSRVWVCVNGTAAIPAGATFATTTSQQNPPGFQVKNGDVLSFITADANIEVGVAIYAVLPTS